MERNEIEAELGRSLSSPVSEEELEEIVARVRLQEELARRLAALALAEEEPAEALP